MNYCKRCGALLTKFDTDLCPYCGEKNPIDNLEQTQNVTMTIDPELQNFKLKKKKHFLLLSILAGFTGSQFFYLLRKKLGAIYLASNLVFLLVFFLIFFLGAHLHIVASILIPLGITYVINSLVGVALYFTNLQDGRGEYIH